MTEKLKKSYLLYSIVLIVCLGLDQVTKMFFQAKLSGGGEITIIPSFLELIYVENRGAAFGLFQGGMIIFALISIVVVCALTYALKSANRKVTAILYAVIAAGAVGNMIDRFIQGFVIDFIHFSNLFGYSFPVFNVADIFLTCGLGLLVLDMLLNEKENKKEI